MFALRMYAIIKAHPSLLFQKSKDYVTIEEVTGTRDAINIQDDCMTEQGWVYEVLAKVS